VKSWVIGYFNNDYGRVHTHAFKPYKVYLVKALALILKMI
jgi:hypothetical protein